MREELDKKLVEDFPLLYADRYGDMRETCMVFGFPGNGWEPIIRRLSEKLERLLADWIRDNPDKDDQHPRAAQVKEKFGTLRFYMASSLPGMDKAIAIAEAESEVTCEYCGKPGEIRVGGWLKTLCDECAEHRYKPEWREECGV